jgi:hypothetical protein
MSRSNERNPNAEQNARRWRGCDDKTKFPSKAKAIGRAKALVRKERFIGMTVYHCHVCHRWHLSSQH